MLMVVLLGLQGHLWLSILHGKIHQVTGMWVINWFVSSLQKI
ncbi:hypothetical protein GLYMA_20G159802v4 [Glycine max]|nr:hypothetical protein GLYMA_20G159802v4 [Glycine max]KAH1036359.1 hypothetical protein GYH30_056026 [Glycine max]